MTFAECIYGQGWLSFYKEMQITLQLYILKIQAIFCWNRGQDTIYPMDKMFGPS